MKLPLKLEQNQHPSELSHWFFFFSKDTRFLKCNFCWPAKSLVGTTCKNDQEDKQTIGNLDFTWNVWIYRNRFLWSTKSHLHTKSLLSEWFCTGKPFRIRTHSGSSDRPAHGKSSQCLTRTFLWVEVKDWDSMVGGPIFEILILKNEPLVSHMPRDCS